MYVKERYLGDDIRIEQSDGRKQLEDFLTNPTELVRLEILCREIGITSGEQRSDLCNVRCVAVFWRK